jgi:hypothetical protein
MAQVVEYLLCKLEDSNSNFSPTKKKKVLVHQLFFCCGIGCGIFLPLGGPVCDSGGPATFGGLLF